MHLPLVLLSFACRGCRTLAPLLEADMECKPELDAHGMRVSARRWQGLYVALRGVALCTYADKKDFAKVIVAPFYSADDSDSRQCGCIEACCCVGARVGTGGLSAVPGVE